MINGCCRNMEETLKFVKESMDILRLSKIVRMSLPIING